jgi:hypothetical protein
MPGIGDVIEGAMQQAPQPGRQETGEDETLMERSEAGKLPVYYRQGRCS